MWLVSGFAAFYFIMAITGSIPALANIANPNWSINFMEDFHHIDSDEDIFKNSPELKRQMEEMEREFEKSIESMKALNKSVPFRIYSAVILIITLLNALMFLKGTINLFKFKLSGTLLLKKAFLIHLTLAIVSIASMHFIWGMPSMPSMGGFEVVQKAVMIITTVIMLGITLIPLIVLQLADKSFLTDDLN